MRCCRCRVPRACVSVPCPSGLRRGVGPYHLVGAARPEDPLIPSSCSTAASISSFASALGISSHKRNRHAIAPTRKIVRVCPLGAQCPQASPAPSCSAGSAISWPQSCHSSHKCSISNFLIYSARACHTVPDDLCSLLSASASLATRPARS